MNDHISYDWGVRWQPSGSYLRTISEFNGEAFARAWMADCPETFAPELVRRPAATQWEVVQALANRGTE